MNATPRPHATRRGPPAEPARILLVEDDRDIRDTLSEVLGGAGYVVELAEDGRAALDRLVASESLPQLILLDLMMPRMDGLEFRRRQLLDARLAAIPAIVVSADRAALQGILRLSIRHVLPKPFDLDELLETVALYCPPPS